MALRSANSSSLASEGNRQRLIILHNVSVVLVVVVVLVARVDFMGAVIINSASRFYAGHFVLKSRHTVVKPQISKWVFCGFTCSNRFQSHRLINCCWVFEDQWSLAAAAVRRN